MKKLMKQWIFCLIAAVSMGLTFTACSDDDDDNGPGQKSDLIGTWKVTQHIYEEKTGGKVEYSNNYGEEENETFTFNENGISDFEGTCKWNYSGGKITFTYTHENEEDEYDSYNVIELTATSLVMEAKYSFTDEGKNWEVYEKYVCKKESGITGEGQVTDLVGTWFYSEHHNTQGEDYTYEQTFVFKNDGTFSEKIREVVNGDEDIYTPDGTYTYSNGQLVLTYHKYQNIYEEGKVETYAARFENGKLILKVGNESDTFTKQ